MTEQPQAVTPLHDVRLVECPEGWAARLEAEQVADGLHLVHLTLTADGPRPAPRAVLEWMHPSLDIQGSWQPGIGRVRTMGPDWGGGVQVSRATSNAPVRCLFNHLGGNRLTFALSDALNAIRIGAGVREETGAFVCRVETFVEPSPDIDHYALTLRLDTRDIPYEQALAEVSAWWAAQPGYAPAPVPAVARGAMYSTWYSFHQRLDVDAVVENCRIARQLGCEAVIVDDGWQTTDASRGYAYCGDWRPERIPDMVGFVRRVHEAGLKFLLWYSVPHVGDHSEAGRRFAGKTLYRIDRHGAAILDPRFPEVREFLIGTYEKALREWDLDGFKLDFVDAFRPQADTPVAAPGDGRDIASVAAAADRLLSDINTRLRAMKPDVALEFRQSYVGPLMRKVGNMFRAGDCPNDAITNRHRTIDIRLLCGSTACHADMIMWHDDETPAAAALQLLAVLFSVPQISVRLDRISKEMREMLGFWLGFWRLHRDVLLDGRLEPLYPAALYPLVFASARDTCIAALYEDMVVRLPHPLARKVHIVNATRNDEVAVNLPDDLGPCTMEAFDCRGRSVQKASATVPAGLYAFPVPPAGLLTLTKK